MLNDDRYREKHHVKTNSSGQEVSKIVGPLFLGIATIFLFGSLSSGSFAAFGLFFIAIPFFVLGGILTKYGFANEAPRYQAAPKPSISPKDPVTKEIANDVVEETKENIQPVKEEITTNVKKEEPSQYPCPYCGHKMEEEAKFCSECGKSLIKICPLCNSENQGHAEFCAKCGERL